MWPQIGRERLPKEELLFQAVKDKFIVDRDGEATLILKVNIKDRLVAFAIPSNKLLNVKVSEDV